MRLLAIIHGAYAVAIILLAWVTIDQEKEMQKLRRRMREAERELHGSRDMAERTYQLLREVTEPQERR